MKFVFIAKHRAIWPVAWLCAALGVSLSGFHAWLTRSPSARSRSDERGRPSSGGELPGQRPDLRRTACLARPAGRRRGLWPAPQRLGYKPRIERLMRLQALRARPRRLPGDTSDRHLALLPANLLDRQFEATQANQKWIADFTYIWTAEGWLYVAAVINLFSCRVIGWSMSATMTAQLVTDALVMAIWRRGKPHALPHHADQGS